jgi:alpha-beta hydrolase superfamily lysophospholipase
MLGLTFEETSLPVGPEQEIHVWIMSPHDIQRSTPTVVHFHGNAENMTSHVLYVAWLVQRGFEVVTFDYRGYGRSKGQAHRLSTIEDGTTVLQYVINNLGRRNIFVLGQSLGGAVATVAVAKALEETDNEDANPIRGLVLESTFDSYRKMARSAVGQFWLLWPLQIPLSYLVTDDLSPEGSVQHLNQIPILQLHGDADPVVPIERGKGLFQQLHTGERTDTNRTFITIPRAGHTPAFGGEQSPYRDVLVEFIQKNSK